MNKGNIQRKRKRNSNYDKSYESKEGILIYDHKIEKTDDSTNIQDEIALDKAVQYINKLWFDKKKLHIFEGAHISVLVCNSEADFFISNEDSISRLCKEHLGLKSILVSNRIDGSVDRLITLFGGLKAICNSLVFIAFILRTRLNNFIKSEVFTFKSNNYCLDLLLPWDFNDKAYLKTFNRLADQHYLREYDVSFVTPFNQNSNIAATHIKGELNTLNMFLMNLLDFIFSSTEDTFFDDFNVKQTPIIHAMDNGALYKTQTVNIGVLEESSKRIIESLFPEKEIASTNTSAEN